MVEDVFIIKKVLIFGFENYLYIISVMIMLEDRECDLIFI